MPSENSEALICESALPCAELEDAGPSLTAGWLWCVSGIAILLAVIAAALIVRNACLTRRARAQRLGSPVLRPGLAVLEGTIDEPSEPPLRAERDQELRGGWGSHRVVRTQPRGDCEAFSTAARKRRGGGGGAARCREAATAYHEDRDGRADQAASHRRGEGRRPDSHLRAIGGPQDHGRDQRLSRCDDHEVQRSRSKAWFGALCHAMSVLSSSRP